MHDAHGAEDALPNETYINTVGVALSIGVTLIVIPIIIIGVYSYFQVVTQEMKMDRAMSAPTLQLDEAQTKWSTENTSYGVVDKAKGRYRIPLDEAKGLYIKDTKLRIAEMKAAAEAAALEEENESLEGMQP